MTKHTYNAVIKQYGEQVGIIYESLVADYIDSALTKGDDAMIIALTLEVGADAYKLVKAAKEHAHQERVEAIDETIIHWLISIIDIDQVDDEAIEFYKMQGWIK